MMILPDPKGLTQCGKAPHTPTSWFQWVHRQRSNVFLATAEGVGLLHSLLPLIVIAR
jgi:hypothetical protein